MRHALYRRQRSIRPGLGRYRIDEPLSYATNVEYLVVEWPATILFLGTGLLWSNAAVYDHWLPRETTRFLAPKQRGHGAFNTS